jgi:hypothetical protein
MRRGRIEMALEAKDASRRISEIENVYLAMSAAETEAPTNTTTTTNNRST